MRTVSRLPIAAAIATAVVLPPVPIPAAVQLVTADPPVHVSWADARHSIGEVLAAADPTNPRRLIACSIIYSNDENRMWVSAYLSEDQGRTWRRAVETRDPSRSNEADPSCTFGRDGRVYLAAISSSPYGSFTTPHYLKLFRSLDGGSHWSQPLVLSTTGLGFDREHLVVDTTGGPHDGTLYMNATTLVRVPGATAGEERQDAVSLWNSRDHGATLDGPVLRPATPGRRVIPRANGVVLSDGTVAVLLGELNRQPSGAPMTSLADWNVPGQAASRLRIATSSDGGRSLALGSTIADCFMSGTLGLGAQTPYLVADPGSTAFKDRLYAVWPDIRSGRSEILLSYSADKGLTWSAPTFVNDDHGRERVGAGGDHFLPVVAVNRHGVVGVSWYDRRDVPDGLGWDVRFAASVDGGETFLPSVRVSSATSQFGPDLRFGLTGSVDDRLDTRQGHVLQVRIQGRDFYAGDTAGIAADGFGVFHPVWIDHHTGVAQVWTAAVTVNGQGVRNGDPALDHLIDVSSSVTLDVRSTSYDQTTGEVAVTVALRNTSADRVPLPLTVRPVVVASELAEDIAATNADNASTGAAAVWIFGERGSSGFLEPRAATAPKILRFRLKGMRPYPKAVEYRIGLVTMRARILAPPER
jgi:hypothetical protein